jgi:DNA polymerase-3 subunit delta'
LIRAGNHPDLYELSLPVGKQSLPIELFIGDRAHRNQTGLCHQLSMRPMVGSRRVAIIDDADYLRRESANCLLKTLEEPPLGSLLILIGTSLGRQLPTILSRTQAVRFSPLSEEHLSQVLQEQQIGPDEAALLAASSEGSLTVAMQYAQGQLSELRERLLPQLTPDRFSSVRLADELGQFVNAAGKEAQLRRLRLRAIIRLVTGHFREQLRSSCAEVAPGSASDRLPADCEAAARATQERALAVLQRSIEADLQVERNANQATLLACWLDDLATVLTNR